MGLRLLKGSNSNFSRYGGEVVKKLLQRMAAFDVVNERLHGNARTYKHRGAGQDVGVGANHGRFLHGELPFKERKHTLRRLLMTPSEINQFEQARVSRGGQSAQGPRGGRDDGRVGAL